MTVSTTSSINRSMRRTSPSLSMFNQLLPSGSQYFRTGFNLAAIFSKSALLSPSLVDVRATTLSLAVKAEAPEKAKARAIRSFVMVDVVVVGWRNDENYETG
jgi:hypothetical protein